ncbi:phage holin family protein [Tenacibaculum sp. C7A-26P2]|uniref:phage holin family protein n=1 Tax=Tenacibaculum sp. C7A-26P2 TaxID=3447504 RepID=UPI003F828F4D
MEVDFSLKGIIQAVSYLAICFYSWLNSVGIDAYAFHVLLLFMVLDMFFGVLKAKKIPELKNPSSREAKKGIVSKIIMFSIPVVVGFTWGLFDKNNAIRVVNTSLIALAIAEGYSVVANAGSVYSGKNLREYDAVTYLFKVVTRLIRGLLEKFLIR